MQNDPLFLLTGKVILITGAAGVLGSAISEALSERGAKLVLTDLDGKAVEALASDCGAENVIESGVLDIRDENSVDTWVSRIAGGRGRIDGLINAAGILRISPMTSMSTDDFTDSIATNLTGPFYLTRAAARVMERQGQGNILHVASVSSQISNPEYAAYSTSKSALSQMIRVAAREFAPNGVTVNAIGPSLVDTPLAQPALSDPDKRKQAVSQIPMGRLCEPEDIVAMAVLLMAPGGSYITGQTIYVDGGRTLV